MFEFVKKILIEEESIIDQLKALEKNKDNKEVKQYMKYIAKCNISPYYRYCIDKYYFKKEVKKVEIPIPKLFINKMIYEIEKQKTIIDQLKYLSNYRKNKIVKQFIENYLYWANDYEKYCIQKYFYKKNIKEVKPTAKNLKIKLFPITNKKIVKKIARKEKRMQKKQIANFTKTIKKIKKGDQIKIEQGPFKDLIGTFISYDKNTKKSTVILKLFEQDEAIEIEERFKIVRSDKIETKS